jgi:hypothetical protein
MLISTPFDLGSILSWQLFSLQLLLVCKGPEWCLVPCYVEVFVHIIQNKLEKLLSILLLVNAPL